MATYNIKQLTLNLNEELLSVEQFKNITISSKKENKSMDKT